MSDSTVEKRRRHVPVRGAPGVYKSQRGKGWVFEVRHPGKARRYETVGTRLDQAKARARDVHGSPVEVASVATRLDEVVADWQRTRQIRPRTAESYDEVWRLHIEPVLGHKKVREIGRREMEAWLVSLRRRDGRDGELASGTKRLALAILQLVLAHAVEMGLIGAVPKLPRRRVPKPSEGRKRVLSAEEERTLLAYCGAFPWLRPIITVALHQALRIGEVLGLQWDDVDFAGGKLAVRRSLGRHRTLGPTKGGREEVIPLTPKAREALLELRMERPEGEGPIFRSHLGGQRQLGEVQRAFDKARKRAGLDDVVFHSLRHTGISRLANHAGIPLVQVRDFARHTDLATTMGYMHKIESEKVTVAIAEALTGGAA
jgi:integrase